MASLSRFSYVSEEEVNALIQKVFSKKTKTARRYGIKISKVRKNEFDRFTRRLVVRVSSALVVCIKSIIY